MLGLSLPVSDDELECPKCQNRVMPGLQRDKDASGTIRERNRCTNCDTPLSRDPTAEDNRWRVDTTAD
jgi:hypothetical protein